MKKRNQGWKSSLAHEMEVLDDKLLVFTEWGSYYVHDNPALFRGFLGKMLSAGEDPRPEKRWRGVATGCLRICTSLSAGCPDASTANSGKGL